MCRKTSYALIGICITYTTSLQRDVSRAPQNIWGTQQKGPLPQTSSQNLCPILDKYDVNTPAYLTLPSCLDFPPTSKFFSKIPLCSICFWFATTCHNKKVEQLQFLSQQTIHYVSMITGEGWETGYGDQICDCGKLESVLQVPLLALMVDVTNNYSCKSEYDLLLSYFHPS